jgi:hypothetical protein
LKLQQTIWRINRSISRSSSVTEALGVIEEMKAAGIDSANEGMPYCISVRSASLVHTVHLREVKRTCDSSGSNLF